ncbi:MAG: hypothetical protein LBS59_07530 [Puniceicoccales bacterium]|jgi:hypothetical protein|nr:hypothetical protein [Puniceicoccales bacterium]
MHITHAFFSIACACASIVAATAAPTASEIIARAREKIGPEDKLKAVNSLVFESKRIDKGDKTSFAQVEYKAPAKRREYRLDRNNSSGVPTEIIIASNGLEGYSKVVNLNTKDQRIRPFQAVQLRFNVDLFYAETGFFSTPPGGSVAYVGETKQKGKDAYSVEYKYAGGLIVLRHFDAQTYKLVAYEVYNAKMPTETRLRIEEEGDKVVDGIHFPEKVTVFVGGEKSYTVEHTQIKVNSNIPDAAFAFPMP